MSGVCVCTQMDFSVNMAEQHFQFQPPSFYLQMTSKLTQDDDGVEVEGSFCCFNKLIEKKEKKKGFIGHMEGKLLMTCHL